MTLSLLHCSMQLSSEKEEEEGMCLQLQQQHLKTIASSCRMARVPEKLLPELLQWLLVRIPTQHPSATGEQHLVQPFGYFNVSVALFPEFHVL